MIINIRLGCCTASQSFELRAEMRSHNLHDNEMLIELSVIFATSRIDDFAVKVSQFAIPKQIKEKRQSFLKLYLDFKVICQSQSQTAPREFSLSLSPCLPPSLSCFILAVFYTSVSASEPSLSVTLRECMAE